MGFTFQINHEVDFTHDSGMLSEADQSRPKLISQTVHANYVVTIGRAKKEGKHATPTQIQDISALAASSYGRSQSVILDFGQHYVGYFSVNISAVGSPMDAPLYLHIRFAEVADELAQKPEDYNGWLSRSWIQEEYVHLDELPATLSMPRRYSFRYVELTVIDSSPKWQAQFENPTVRAVSSADDARLPKLATADTELKQIYSVSVRTLHECMQTVFEDGPKRDRRLWLGDLHLAALADYATYNQTDLVRRCLFLFAGLAATDGRIPANIFTGKEPEADDTFLFDYSMFFVSTLSDYYKHTRDHETLDRLLPAAQTQIDLALQYVDEQGQLNLPDNWPVFIDWSDKFDKSSCAQLILIYTLKQFIGLLQECKQSTESYRNYVDILSQYVLVSRRDSKTGLITSGSKSEVNVATQAWTVLAGVLPRIDAAKLMRQTINQLFPVRGIATPYMYHFIVQALFEAGLRDEAIAEMKRYWGKMVELGADTFWEAFDPDDWFYSPYGNSIISSYCHVWSCTPAYLIHKYC
ncbi:alpha-rhamnosidase [Lacticaseibacillus sp. 53-4]|uniref:alpha-L-rhamnosidase-related protein n=1 Tax=Lacticaseibacillus sp. 53-4 TaxID=2799575 RepID=UPI00194307D4|nr:alpha-rhamnosidase [Lacticaseibacillus sp. 53-4]